MDARNTIEDFDYVMKYANPLFQKGVFTIHDLLWQIMINQTTQGKNVAFHCNVAPGGNELVIAHETGGYQSTGVLFLSSDHDECSEVCDQLNIEVFDMDVPRAWGIVSRSMTTELP